MQLPLVYVVLALVAFGGEPLWFDRIELHADSKDIASDVHRGFTGTPPKDVSYNLTVKSPVPAEAALILRATADSHEGTDSTGSIVFRRSDS